MRNLELKRRYRECEAFNENVVGALKRLEPDVVVTAVSRWQHPIDEANESYVAQGNGMARLLQRVPGRKVIIADVPYPGQDVPGCLAKNIKDIRPCAVPASGRVSGGSPLRERTAARAVGGKMLDFGNVICGGSRDCPVVNDDIIVFRDHHHLTATFAKSMAPQLDQALQRVLQKRGR